MNPSTLLLLLIALILVAWWAVRLAVTVRRDGYGTRRPPASRHDWTEGLPWPGPGGPSS